MRARFSLLLAAACLVLTAAFARAYDSVVVINELQYHPANEQTEGEWIELRSLHGVDVNLSNWSLAGDVAFTFPGGSFIPGGGHLVVAKIPSQIPGALGPFTGQLGNSSGVVRLVNQNGRIMDELRYDDSGDWPVGADGSGATLSRREATAASGAGAWAASLDLGGTPRGTNFYEGAPPVQTRVIAIGDTWKYDDSGSAPGAGWQSAGFDDSAWKSGPTLITGGGARLTGGASPSSFPSGLLAHWAFDETSGATAANGAPGGPAGSMANGAAFVTDPARGRVAAFDGSNDRMEVINPATGLPSLVFLPQMTAANDFTWAAWVRSDTSATSGNQFGSVILGNRTNPSGQDTSPREFIKIMPTSMQYHRNANTENLNYPDLETARWTHMCVVKRGQNLDYYLDGEYVQTLAISGGLSNALPFYVGGDRSGTAEHFHGRVDDVGLWTRALTAVEIAQLGREFGPSPAMPNPPEQTTDAATGPQPRYFRKAFNFDGSPSGASLELWAAADDGAVIYLNGVEVWRQNAPPVAEVGDATFTSEPTTISNAALVRGMNVLSAEVHQFPGGNNDLLFGAELVISSPPGPPPAPPASLVFNEIAAATDADFFIELRNLSTAPISTAGWSVKSSSGGLFSIPVQSIPAGDYLVIGKAALGFSISDGMRLFLIAPGGAELRDARAVANRTRGLNASGVWAHPTSATPGGENVVAMSDAVIINEIFYKGMNESPEQWVELHNRSASPVDLSAWRISSGIDYIFPAGAMIPAGGFVVVAWDPAAFSTLHPGVTALGPFSGSLSGKGERLRLRDANDNIVNEVRYADSGRWPEYADGGGSSLELRNPHADNSAAEAWTASDESAFGAWQSFSFTGSGANPVASDPTNYHEFVAGLLHIGEVLIDDISVREDPNGTNRELIQNGGFDSGTAAAWRLLGNHRHSTIVDDPDAPGNKVLKLVATGPTEHMSNHAETTFKSGGSYVSISSALQYRISFRARWLGGNNRLNTRMWHNRLPRTSALTVPPSGGTPGAPNRALAANLGPTYSTLAHSPVVPPANAPATVIVRVADGDGVTDVQLFTSVNGGPFTSAPMSAGGEGIFSATVAGRPAGTKVQFYIRATDSLGAVSFFPAAGVQSRAMIPWNDNAALAVLPSGARPRNIRVVVTAADDAFMLTNTNLMSNERLPCTVIVDEKDVYYNARVRLKSSEHGRISDQRVGYILNFGSDEPFLGAHETVAVDRSGGVSFNQYEVLVKQVLNHARGIIATEDDIIRLIGTRPTYTGPAILSKSRFDSEFLDGQWEGGADGTLFKYERIYVLTQTVDGTPEGLKIPQDSTSPPGVNIGSLGPDKEAWRWYWLIRNNRDRDDFTQLMPAVTALGLSGTAYLNQTRTLVDVDGYLRGIVGPRLFGITDNYASSSGSQHNAMFYTPPGGKLTYIPWDMDFLNQSDPNASLTSNHTELSKWLASGTYKRAYWAHIHDVLNTSFNTAFLTRWANHYSRFGVDMNSSLSYLSSRATYAASQVSSNIPPVPFRIVTASPLTVSTPFAAIIGDGWVDIAEIRLSGSGQGLPVTWVAESRWTLQLPLRSGTHDYTLTAHNPQGVQIGSASITVTATGNVFPAGPGSLVASELHYNPPGSSDATEFIELLNITSNTLDLGGCHFDEEYGEGIAYTFPAGVQLAPGARLLVVRDRTAFIAQYGNDLPLAPGVFSGSLDNNGESIVLYAASGLEIFRFTYNDALGSTDGDGRTLVRVLSSSNPNPSDYTWRASVQNGGSPNGTDAIAFNGDPLADDDRDGFEALVEYAFGTSDTDPASRPLDPHLQRHPDGSITATYTVVPNADDAIVTPQTTSSLDEPWQPVTGAAPPSDARFFRVEVKLR